MGIKKQSNMVLTCIVALSPKHTIQQTVGDALKRLRAHTARNRPSICLAIAGIKN